MLKLTYATLEQVNSISADGQTDESGGPVWSRFFASFGQTGSVDEDATSAISGSHIEPSELPPLTPSNRFKSNQLHPSRGPDTPGSELAPNDSASVIHDETDSALVSRSGITSFANGRANGAPPVPIDFDDGTYLFKFIAPSGSAHRFQARYDSYEFVREIIHGKIQADPFFAQLDENLPSLNTKPESGDFQLSYFDDDNDLVLITSDQDIIDSVNLAKKQSKDRVVLHLRGGKSWGDLESVKKKNVNQITRLKAVSETEEKDEIEEAGNESESLLKDDDLTNSRSSKTRQNKKSGSKKHATVADDAVVGIPKELVLPAAIGFLGFVILGVFMASRPSR